MTDDKRKLSLSTRLHIDVPMLLIIIALLAYSAFIMWSASGLDLDMMRFQPSEIAKIAVPLMVARFMNRDTCPPSFKNTCIALVFIFVPTLS